MNIIELKISEVKPYEKNPRKNDKSVDKVANSIKEFGFKVPIVIDKNNIIVCGHTRYKAAKKLGLSVVPCVVADDLTEEQKKVAKKYTKADRKKTVNAYGKTVTRERKPDEDKQIIIDLLYTALKVADDDFSNLEIANKEKLITFTYNGNDYKLDLVKHRKKKGE